MTEHGDAYTTSNMTHVSQIASDIKDDQSGFLSGISTFYVVVTVLLITLAVALIADLAWREKRQRRQEAAVAPPHEIPPREGETPP
ncbi:hypothetical protein [Streptomyces sp. WAC00263]|uniref:hypothetical protein n=1 Tax=Streptomyces sp. WAC00263 TaxID=1917422 RepID=UPI0009CB6614|nr:hypothetical protein [Streptomyces sp. WAC00263]KAF5990695.1 hypothetical protein BOG92_000590 [Streptomyces sp. WAC00263]